MGPQAKHQARRCIPRPWRPGSGHAVPLAVVVAVLLAGGDLNAQNAPAASQPTTSTPASAPASAKPSISQLVGKVWGQFDAKTRREAAVAVLDTGSADYAEGVKALVDVFKTENNQGAKLAVCEAIAQTRSQEEAFKQPLLALAESNAPLPRDAAAEALAEALREAAIAALEGYEHPATRARVQALKDKRELQRVKRMMAALMQFAYDRAAGEELVPLLQAWLKDELPFVRATALDIMYQALRKKSTKPPKELLPQLRTMLNDPDEDVRTKLVEILRELGEARALEARLAQESSVTVRELIYHALGHIRDPESIPACVGGLKDPVEGVAAKAASALGKLAEFAKPAPDKLKPAVDALIQRASSGLADNGLREGVTEAMARIANPKFLDLLIKHAGGDEPLAAVRQLALQGIGRIGDASPVVLALVIERLGAEQDPVILEAAAEALGQLGSKIEHLQPLRERLNANEPMPTVQQKARDSYRRIFLRLQPKDQQEVIGSWPDETIKLAADAQLKPEDRAKIAKPLLEYARATGKGDPKAALGFLDKLTEAIPPERRGAALATELAELRKKFQADTQPASAASAPAAG